jgi:hypothetical protein
VSLAETALAMLCIVLTLSTFPFLLVFMPKNPEIPSQKVTSTMSPIDANRSRVRERECERESGRERERERERAGGRERGRNREGETEREGERERERERNKRKKVAEGARRSGVCGDTMQLRAVGSFDEYPVFHELSTVAVKSLKNTLLITDDGIGQHSTAQHSSTLGTCVYQFLTFFECICLLLIIISAET